MTSAPRPVLVSDPLLDQLLAGRLHDPFAFLGLHPAADGWRLRVFRPHAEEIWLHLPTGLAPLRRVHPAGLFEWAGTQPPAGPCLLGVLEDGRVREMHDPYAFAPVIGGHDLYLLNEGRLRQGWRVLGTQVEWRDGVLGTRFAVWAPNAERVSVIGDFNRWDGRVHPMAVHGSSGVWELFIPGLQGGELYKFEIRNRATGEILVKIDPYAQQFERRPGTSSRVSAPTAYQWNDAGWLAARAGWDWQHAPVNVYEVHLGSWKRHPDGRFYTYR